MAAKKKTKGEVWMYDWCTIRVPVALRARLSGLRDAGASPTMHGVIVRALDAADLQGVVNRERREKATRPKKRAARA